MRMIFYSHENETLIIWLNSQAGKMRGSRVLIGYPIWQNGPTLELGISHVGPAR